MSSDIAARYMTRVQCLGSACEDTCCSRWTIPVDETHYTQIQHALDGNDADRQQFRDAFRKNTDPSRGRGTFAIIQLRDDSFCPLLDAERLCSLHRRFGEAVLADGCAVHPRHISRVVERHELFGELSCPEAARQCLLAEDALDLVEIAPPLLGRVVATQTIESTARDPWVTHLDEVRGTLYQLLAKSAYPVESRLFFGAYLAQQVGQFYRPYSDSFDPARLEHILSAMQEPALLDRLDQTFRAVPAGDPFAPSLALALLGERLQKSAPPPFIALVARALQSLTGEETPTSPDPRRVAAAYHARHQALPPWAAERLALYLRNYAQNYWMSDWYLLSSSLLMHVLKLFMRLALVRLLLVGSLTVETLRDPAQLDAAAVALVYSFSRAFEHGNLTFARFSKTLEEQKAVTLPHALALLKL